MNLSTKEQNYLEVQERYMRRVKRTSKLCMKEHKTHVKSSDSEVKGVIISAASAASQTPVHPNWNGNITLTLIPSLNHIENISSST